MWDKKDAMPARAQQPPPPARAEADPAPPPPAAPPQKGRAANIGGSLFIKGEVTGSEDLTVEGRVEGRIDLKDHNLSIAKGGRVNAEIHAKTVTINGEVSGNVHADEKVEISDSGRVLGDLFAPRVAISDGAQFKGSVDMSAGRTEAAVSVRQAVRMPEPARESQPRGGTVRQDEVRVAVQAKAGPPA